MALSQRYDFYLIFHESDSEKADEILEHFEKEENGGFRGFYSERDSASGTYLTNLAAALEQSRWVFILLSKNSFENDWFQFKLESSIFCHHKKKKSRIIPVYLEPVDHLFMQLYIGIQYESTEFWTRMRKALDS